MRLAIGLMLLAGSASGAAMHHASGTFTVTITPETAPPGAPFARMDLAKHFHGGLEATAHGVMLADGKPGTGTGAAYVALDRVEGALDGRRGSFLLVHRGTMRATGDADLQVIVAPDTATGDLKGLTGTLTITVANGTHHYTLAYSLP